MKLTKHSVAELILPPGKTEHVEWDDELPGFGLRLRKSKRGVSKTYRIHIASVRSSAASTSIYAR